MLEITISGSGVIAEELREFPRRAQRAIVRALNRGIQAGETLMAREVARDVGMKVSDAKAAMRRQDASLSTPVAVLAANLKRIPLIKLGARGPQPSRGRGRGVTYNLPGGRGRIEEAFIARVRGSNRDGSSGNHLGVFVRAAASTRKSRGAWSKNLPIKQKFGPSLGHVFAKYRAQGQARAIEAFETTLDHELEFRRGGGGA